jgi:hypothetical protein
MGKNPHLILMYVTEGVAAALWIYAAFTGFNYVPTLGALAFTVITATHHELYLLSEIYRKLEGGK